MPEQESLQILTNESLGNESYYLRLKKKKSCHAPGQFLHLAIPGFALRRPISVCDEDEHTIGLYYKKVGAGTAVLSTLQHGELDCLTACGNSFSLETKEILLLGGGVGVAPLLFAAKKASERGVKVRYIFGFRQRELAVFEERLQQYGEGIYCYDSEGENVIDALKRLHWEAVPFLCCGPLPMMKAVYANSSAKGQFSLECRMGCGFGACMGCSTATTGGNRRICKEGPVFDREELLWND